MTTAHSLLRLALVASGAAMLLLYPLSMLWPSGWAWHAGAPHDSQYFTMIVGIYATLGVFLVTAARNPRAHLTLIWFAVWSSLVHAAIMAVHSTVHGHHRAHLVGDVPALLLVAVLLAALVRAAGLSAGDPGVRGEGVTGAGRQQRDGALRPGGPSVEGAVARSPRRTWGLVRRRTSRMRARGQRPSSPHQR